ncbi:hypothetical protein J6590_014926 [Homalodisca vitripennis]|nr:hypothetical protein J6590_014926 [Homalodisca vitripennis]
MSCKFYDYNSINVGDNLSHGCERGHALHERLGVAGIIHIPEPESAHKKVSQEQKNSSADKGKSSTDLQKGPSWP